MGREEGSIRKGERGGERSHTSMHACPLGQLKEISVWLLNAARNLVEVLTPL